MSKKLFSIFITIFVAVSGVAVIPESVDALSFGPTPDCQVEGIVVEALFKEAQPNHPAWSGGGGSSERYQLLVHITGAELLGDAQHGDCSDDHQISYNLYYSFPLDILSDGATVNSILGQQISFKAGRYGEYSSDAVFTQRPGQLDFCTIEGVLISEPAQAMPMCTTAPCYGFTSFDFNITQVQGVNNLCSANFPVGAKSSTFLTATNLLDVQDFAFEKGSKIRLRGTLEAGSTRLKSLYGLVLASPEPEKPEDPKDEDDSDSDEEEVIPNDPVSPYPTQNNNFGMGVIAGLLGGLIVLVITLLIKRKK
jgi:hypothetical protein